jgi:hypothetical protein
MERKSCPLCGGENIVFYEDPERGWYIGCMPPSGCLTLFGYWGTEKIALKYWNRRPVVREK